MNKAIVDLQQKAMRHKSTCTVRRGEERREEEGRREEGRGGRGGEKRGGRGEKRRGEEGADYDLQSVEPLPISVCDSSLAT